jgi:hypothetical protein
MVSRLRLMIVTTVFVLIPTHCSGLNTLEKGMVSFAEYAAGIGQPQPLVSLTLSRGGSLLTPVLGFTHACMLYVRTVGYDGCVYEHDIWNVLSGSYTRIPLRIRDTSHQRRVPAWRSCASALTSVAQSCHTERCNMTHPTSHPTSLQRPRIRPIQRHLSPTLPVPDVQLKCSFLYEP